MKESEPRVFVVVDNRSVRTSIADVLMTEGYVVEKFASAAEYLARTPYPCPVCIILEAQLPGFDSLAFQRQLTKEQIVFVTRDEDTRMAIEAMKRGAIDYLLEPFRRDELLSAVARALARSVEVVESHARLARLTPRELEVFEWLIAGLINKQIAEEVGVTLRTIKQHRARVMQKTGAVSLVELVRLAMKAGVAPAQPRATCRSNMELAAVWHKQLSAAG
jgi:FixJ family two-component response regulator